MTRGGRRVNSGRKAGFGKFGVPTKAIRIPEYLVKDVYQFVQTKTASLIPFYGSTIKAGFPSPADDYIENKLDLNNHLIKHPAATFIVRASGTSMIGAGICDQALLIVDRSIEPSHGKIVVAVVNGEFTVKRFHKTKKVCFLVAENPDFPPIEIKEGDELQIWGVVTHVINQMS
jgi:DNA polymerase V